MNSLKKIFFIVLLFSLTFSYGNKKSYLIDQMSLDLGIPWGMAFLQKDKLLITQKDGQILLLDLFTRKKTFIKNAPEVFYTGQAGLLDVKLSPNYKIDKWIYFTYVKKDNKKGSTTLSRAKLVKNSLVSWQDLLVSKSSTENKVHYGSRIAFDDNNHVFFSIGDRGIRANSQDLTNHAGTIIRLNMDGSIPFDNPFVNDDKVLDEIYSYGHRNPQGMFFDKKTKKLWSIEHGPRGGDEINIIEKGKNYGWPVISYGKEYWAPLSIGEGVAKVGMEQPIKYYIPSIAPSSILVYSGKLFKEWEGNIFSGALRLTHLNRIILNDKNETIKEERLLKEIYERIRNVIEDEDGYIYVSTDTGRILRLKPNDR
ncbi:PQQ-dependent sugar dehydrogenase [Poseidonibacter lekithochrous]|uniref:PQQ-dependent sugar dehydrogenase n=1 Tax=Poseidonibacter lekithochrous TaxID=1904463 RepID=UPI000D3CE7DF|nr:PQQ-dependent sugar dehydrogenase [Poseidonibacter lekithochrous]